MRAVRAAKESLGLLQRMSKLGSLDVHSGCVNTLQWSSTGGHILSGSDDHRLIVTEPYTGRVALDFHTAHKSNIFSAKFLPESSDTKIVSCSGDGSILYTDVERTEETHGCLFNCHSTTTYELQTVPGDPHTFLSCGEDGTVRWFDLRIKQRCDRPNCKRDVLIKTTSSESTAAVTAMSINPLMPSWIAVGSSDGYVRVFDRRMMGTENEGRQCMAGLAARFDGPGSTSRGAASLQASQESPATRVRRKRITSVDYRPDGAEILVSYSSEDIYVFDPMSDCTSESGKRLCVGYTDDLELLESATEERAVGERSRNSPGPSKSTTNKKPSPPPPMKRLRLRGDWSDTGPNARPENLSSEATPPAAESPSPSRAAGLSPGGRPENVSGAAESGLDPSENPPASENALDQDVEARGEDAEGDSQQGNLMQRMTEALSRMLNDPNTRMAMRNINDRREAAATRIQRLQRHRVQQRRQHELQTQAHPLNQEVEEEEGPAVPSETEATSPLDVNEGSVEENEADSNMRRSIETLRTSISDMRDELIQGSSHRSEPMVRLRRSAQGSESNLVSVEHGQLATSETSNDFFNNEPIQAEEPRARPSIPDITIEDGEEQSEAANVGGDVRESQSSPDSVREAPTHRSTSPVIIRNLPGPSTVIGDQGNSGTNPLTGQRQRRRGVSGPPTETFHLCKHGRQDLQSSSNECSGECATGAAEIEPEIIEFEIDSCTLQNLSSDIKPPDVIERVLGASTTQPHHVRRTSQRFRSLRDPYSKQKFTGHRNARTMMKEATWWGNDFVLSGSDCGHLFGWDRHTGRLVLLLEADRHVVNCVQPHPFEPLIATSGIDYNVKLWSPIAEECNFNQQTAKEVVERNKVMLEETRDTITVPATLMIRMLASLNQIRRAGGISGRPGGDNSDARESMDED